MKTIWKLNLLPGPNCYALPADGEFLTVQIQNGAPVVWVKLDPTHPNVSRVLRVYGTGHEIEVDGDYIGTFQMPDDRLVFHVFEVKP